MLPTTDYLAAIPHVSFPVCGRLTRSVGLLLESTGPDLPVGALVKVSDRKSDVVCEVVGFRDERLLMLAIEETRQLAPDSLVAPLHLTFKAGPWVLGRVLDGLGRPLDGKPVPSTGERIELEPSASRSDGARTHRYAARRRRSRRQRPDDTGSRAEDRCLRDARRRQKHAARNDGARDFGRRQRNRV